MVRLEIELKNKEMIRTALWLCHKKFIRLIVAYTVSALCSAIHNSIFTTVLNYNYICILDMWVLNNEQRTVSDKHTRALSVRYVSTHTVLCTINNSLLLSYTNPNRSTRILEFNALRLSLFAFVCSMQSISRAKNIPMRNARNIMTGIELKRHLFSYFIFIPIFFFKKNNVSCLCLQLTLSPIR